VIPEFGYIYQFQATSITAELQALQAQNWVDDSSRIVVFEFGLYNRNRDIYILVSHITEISAFGAYVSKIEYLNVNGETFGPTQWRLVVLILFVLSYIVQEVQEWINTFNGKSVYFDDFWNKIDMIIFIPLLAMLVIKIFLRYERIESFDNLTTVAYYNYAIDLSISYVCLLVWLRMLYYVQAIEFLGPLIICIASMYKAFLKYVALCTLFVCGLSVYFTIVFYADSFSFTTIIDSFYNIALYGIGKFVFFTGYTDGRQIYSNFIILGFAIMLVIIFTNILIAMMGGLYDGFAKKGVETYQAIIAELVSHYRYPYFFPPFNIFQLIINIFISGNVDKDTFLRFYPAFENMVQLFKDKLEDEFPDFWENTSEEVFNTKEEAED